MARHHMPLISIRVFQINIGVMDSGPAPRGASRNDDRILGFDLCAAITQQQKTPAWLPGFCVVELA
jgi:hypothetical protein